MKKIIYMVAVLMIASLTACSPKSPAPDNTGSRTQGETTQEAPTTNQENETTMDRGVEDPVMDILGSMTVEEKVGQLFIAAFRYNEKDQPMQVLDEGTKLQISKIKPGGVILFSQNIDSISQTSKLISDIKSTGDIPPFIAVDEEGGKISRLNSSKKMHATKLPGNEVLGRTNDPQMAYEVGVILGQELASLGFNMDFAPVADVNTNHLNPVIGNRSFGSDPDKVAAMVEAMVKGIQDQNVSAVLKHFPGHGDTSSDTHTGAVSINHDLERLRKVEFIPFEKGISAGADAVMTAHIQAPKITGDSIPATMSKMFLTDILRNELKYDKLIITDALEMGAISKYWSSSEAAVKAFQAGADMLLIPESLEEAYNGILKAVQDGSITEERLNASVKRILEVKKNRGILDNKSSGLDPEKTLGSKEHLDIIKQITEAASKK